MSVLSQNIAAAIARMTDNSDMRLLESCLLSTLDELFKLKWLAFYRRQDGETRFASALLSGLPSPALAEFETPAQADHRICWVDIQGKNGEVLGTLRLAREVPLNDSELVLVECLTRIYDNYLTALRNAQLDRLTGLLNRHTFDEQLENALQLIRHNYASQQAAHAQRRPLSDSGNFFLGVLDIDHFKQVNDRFGHLYGDEVLIILARLLKKTFRDTDLIYRFGGEEFVVIIYVNDEDDAMLSFERLRTNVEAYDFPQVGKVTVSIGFTQIQSTMASVEILGHADQALYYAKEHGRNQCCFYEALVANQELTERSAGDDFVLF